MIVRSSYPESKRLCECLCTSYWSEYSVPVKVMRLTQTFGPGVSYYDGRVFAEFARCVIEKRDITLHTKGETKRNYLYTADAVTAILSVLNNGQAGEAYNTANAKIYCSVREMAEMFCAESYENRIGVKIQIQDANVYGYAPVLFMNLDTTKLEALGWKARFDMRTMIKNLCESMRNNQ